MDSPHSWARRSRNFLTASPRFFCALCILRALPFACATIAPLQHRAPMNGKIEPIDLQPYRFLARILLALSIALLLVLTLLPQGSRRDINLVPLAGTAKVARAVLEAPAPTQHPAFRYFLIQVGGNVLAFLPIGASLSILLGAGGFRKALFQTLAVSALLSLSIELIQLALPTRATDVDDLILNSLGAFLGALRSSRLGLPGLSFGPGVTGPGPSGAFPRLPAGCRRFF